MARYAVFAADELYKGLHGMNSTFVTEAESDREVDSIARDASLDVIDSYMCIRDDLYEGVDLEDYETMNEIALGDIMYEWALIDEELAGNYSTKELDSMAYDMGYEEFVEAYCSHTS